mgnify:CR=1 FL=1
MTINKYLQDKVDINEIIESDRDFILKAIDKIDNKKILEKNINIIFIVYYLFIV